MVSSPGATKNEDLLYDTFYSAAIGGAVVAVFFLVMDLMDGQPLFTPSLLGSTIFAGEDPVAVADVRMDMVAFFTVIHFAAFGTLGFLVSFLIRDMESLAAHPGIIALIVFFALSTAFFVPTSLWYPGLAQEVGVMRILIANVLTALAMGIFLRRAHPDAHD